MYLLHVDLGILQETKLTHNIYTHIFGDYRVMETEASSASQGGVALFWGEIEHYEIKEVTKHRPNVITVQLVIHRDSFYIVGYYIPPSDHATLEEVKKAWKQCPKGCLPLLIGDLNVDL